MIAHRLNEAGAEAWGRACHGWLMPHWKLASGNRCFFIVSIQTERLAVD